MVESTPPVLQGGPIVVLDTETNGFIRDRSSNVLEIAAVVVNADGTVHDPSDPVLSFSSLVRAPAWPQDWEKAEAIHGIPRAEVEAAPLPGDVFSRLLAWWPKPEGRMIRWTSYNRDFDGPMVERTFGSNLDVLAPRAPCIMRAAMKVMHAAGACPTFRSGKPKFPKLTEAAAYFRIGGPAQDHRALGDAVLAARVLVALNREAAERVGVRG